MAYLGAGKPGGALDKGTVVMSHSTPLLLLQNLRQPFFLQNKYSTCSKISSTFLFLVSNGPQRDKPVFGVSDKASFKPVQTRSSATFVQKLARKLKFPYRKFTQGSFQKVNKKGDDQTAQMPSMVCACVVNKLPKTGFLASRPK